MSVVRTEQLELTVQRMDKELITKGAEIPLEELFKFEDSEGTFARDRFMAEVKKLYAAASPASQNEEMAAVDIYDLARLIVTKTGQIEENRGRGIWYVDGRMDYYGIPDERVKKNAGCVAAVTLQDNLIDLKNGFSELRVKNYAKAFNLWDQEPFREQPVSVGPLCTGFLVGKKHIATAAHFTDDYPLEDLRIVFGYKMPAPGKPVMKFPNDDIYKVGKILHSVRNRQDQGGDGSDFALLDLDREVSGQEVARLSKEPVASDQPVYVIGHPLALPLKYGPGAHVRGIEKAFFSADLDVYMGNSGSPVFNANTHEVVGMVVRGDTRDFRWTGKGWGSVIYPSREFTTTAPQCTLVSEFSGFYK